MDDDDQPADNSADAVADPEHLARLRQGTGAWNDWRIEVLAAGRPLSICGADLSGVELSGADLSGVDFSGANLTGADLRAVDLRGANLSETNLSGADLRKAHFSEAVLFRANFSGADLRGANLSGVDLRTSVLSKAQLSDANLSKAELSGVDLSVVVDLIGAELCEAELGGANLSGVHLDSANLSGAKLSGADLRTTKLENANLSGADLSWSEMNEAEFMQANLTDANVTGVKFDRKTMQGKCLGVRGIESTYGNAIFKRVVADQDFLDALEREWSTPWRQRLFRAWSLIDYGRCLWCVAVIGVALIVFFGTIFFFFPATVGMSCPPAEAQSQTIPPTCAEYAWFKPYSFPGFKPESFSVTCTPLPAPPPSEPVVPCTVRSDWLTPYYFSTVTFTTLGFGDYYAKTAAGEVLVILEVIAGYTTLGLMLSVLADKVARRS